MPLCWWGKKDLPIQGSRDKGPAGRLGQGKDQGHPTAKALVGTIPTIKEGTLEADCTGRGEPRW